MNSCTGHVQTEGIYKDVLKNVEQRFDTSNDKLERPLSKVKNKKVIGLMKDELRSTVRRELVELGAKLLPVPLRFLTDDKNESKKPKDTKIVS